MSQPLRPVNHAQDDSVLDYSIVVPAYNEEKLLPATLRTLREAMNGASSERQGEIIVVDNNSTDTTADIARQAGVRVVFEPINRISRARNTGAREACGCHLIFVDADTHVPPALLTGSLDALLHQDVGAGGALLQFDEDGPIGFSTSRLPQLWNRLSRNLRLAAGSYLFARRDAFEAVGGFSEKVYAGEEIFISQALKRWCRRNRKTFRILTEPPVLTSARKLKWHSPARLLAVILLPALFPFLLCSKRFCSFWYVRPELPPD